MGKPEIAAMIREANEKSAAKARAEAKRLSDGNEVTTAHRRASALATPLLDHYGSTIRRRPDHDIVGSTHSVFFRSTPNIPLGEADVTNARGLTYGFARVSVIYSSRQPAPHKFKGSKSSIKFQYPLQPTSDIAEVEVRLFNGTADGSELMDAGEPLCTPLSFNGSTTDEALASLVQTAQKTVDIIKFLSEDVGIQVPADS